MVSDISKWKIINGVIDTSLGDFDFLEKQWKRQAKQWIKEKPPQPKLRKRLTTEEKRQRRKEYNHKYYLKVTKIKRKMKKEIKNER